MLKLIFSKLKKLESKLFNINKKLIECNNMETYKLYGELIVNNLYKIDKTHLDNITLNNYYTNEEITIPLDKSLTPYDNAQKYFKKYNKLKNTLEVVNVQKKDSEKELDYLGSLIYELDNANDIDSVNEIYNEISENILFNDNFKQNKKDKKETTSSNENYLRLTIDGYTVLVGKNNRQNDYLTTRLANKEDIWLHVKDAHGSHVILRTENKIPSQDTINKCAKLAKEYSKSSESSNVPVDYTFVKFVKKPSGSKPGMVIYTNNKSVNV